MSTATLTGAPVTQLTFPWAQAEDEATIVAEANVAQSVAVEITNVPPAASAIVAQPVVAQPAVEEVASSLTEALEGDRIGRPFKMGSVMFRLLKSYGITDEEIAAGVAAYNARKAVK